MSQLKAKKVGNIGVIEFYNPPYNFMTSEIVREFDKLTRDWEKDTSVRAIIITGGLDDVFITHYDVADILKMFRPLQITPAFLRGISNFSSRMLGKLIRALNRIQPAGRLFEAILLKTPLFGVVELECVHRTFNRLQCMGKVVIAAINGDALGGATELALSCDYRLIADGDYRMGLPEVTAAIMPGAGGTQRLTRLLGVGRALELMLEGKQLTPEEALEIGLVHRIVEKESLMDEAIKLANQMAKRPPVSIRGIKEAVRIGGSEGFMRGLEIEKKGFYATGHVRDAVNALEFMLNGFQNGKTDHEILLELKTGDTIRFTGK
jgi:enoyl-CoA hydratase